MFAAAVVVNAPGEAATNAPLQPARGRASPTDAKTRSKAGFMAAAGLVVLSLLILAAGLALLRAFRQR